MRGDIVPGGTFPDHELADPTNVPRRRSELRGAAARIRPDWHLHGRDKRVAA